VGWATLSILTEIGVTTPGIAIDLLGGGISRSYGDKFGLIEIGEANVNKPNLSLGWFQSKPCPETILLL
jgi:hypothetical protein